MTIHLRITGSDGHAREVAPTESPVLPEPDFGADAGLLQGNAYTQLLILQQAHLF